MNGRKRAIASFLATLMLLQVVAPTAAFALSTGPSQPEVQSFQPAGAPDMVDLFTGDMSYNIPLLDVEGYPVNLFYQGGVGMDQEASWVGLGWNINPGVVNRNLRGLPDDFSGEYITRKMGMRPNRTFGLMYNVGLQLFGVEEENGSLGVTPSFNNYTGPEFETSFSLSMRSTIHGNTRMTAGLGLTSHSNRGLQLRPTIGFDSKVGERDTKTLRAGLNFGLTLDSQKGLTNMSFGAVGSTIRSTGAGASKKTFSGSDRAGTTFDLGSPTYSPQVSVPMDNLSLSFNFTLGPEFNGGHPNMTMGAFYSRQKLRLSNITQPAYGYLYMGRGQDVSNALLDFNREKDGPYSADRTALGIASTTNDVFTATGQGVSGSYRPYRSEVGHVFDPSNSSTGSGGSAGLEFGAGFIAHVGGNVLVNTNTSTSGDWLSGNGAGQRLKYKAAEPLALEPVFFREANEPTLEEDSTLWNAMQEDRPMRFAMNESGMTNVTLGTALTQGGGVNYGLPQLNYRQKREPRAQLFSFLTHDEADHFGVEPPPDHAAVLAAYGNVFPKDQMSEVTITAKDGSRSIYGIPAYNVVQRDVEFNVEDHLPDASGNVDYTSTENSTDNASGREHYYSCSSTPPYAYSFLLTSILSNDYSDVDDTRGPSQGDLGNYTKFSYTRTVESFPWRTPSVDGDDAKARFERCMLAENYDDKATYSYGEKEIWYLDKIESRNFIAVFELNDIIHHADPPRLDAHGVNEDGTVNTAMEQRYLKTIKLYERSGYIAHPTTAVPIKTVHFDYRYTLCPGTPTSTSVADAENLAHAKLTLVKVWFTYGGSDLGITTPYYFGYNGPNPSYAALAQDRWGNYKPEDPSLSSLDFPYAEQASATADANAAPWALTHIILPSGGTIVVDYEADDYAYVQNKPAMRMFKLTGTSSESGSAPDLPTQIRDNNKVYFALSPEEYTADLDQRLFAGIGELYYRINVEVFPGHWDYVSGYARVKEGEHGVDNSDPLHPFGWIVLDPVPVDEGSSTDVDPLYRSALEHLQLNYPDRVHPGAPSMDDGETGTETFFYDMISSVTGFVTGVGDFFHGPNATLDGRGLLCRSADEAKSWIRLNDPDHRKMGGGYRVKSVHIRDNWGSMEPSETDKATEYGQVYTYRDENGSFGVAAFEPMSGADENPWRMPVYGEKPNAPLTPDERFYQEEPFGESMFPSPVVGYSKVIVSDYFPDAVSGDVRTTQGKGTVVNEFYTAYDFPTITARTGLMAMPKRNTPDLLSLLGFRKRDHMFTSQGFTVETNDMHGKQKRVSVYPQGSDQAISITDYTYATRTDGSGRLTNGATVIDPQGNIGRAQIGRQYEFLADMREFVSSSTSGGAELNLETIWAAIVPGFVPVVLPRFSSSSTKFKSGVLVKRIHRFGLLTEITHTENGSKVTTENLAYDATTGGVLLTRVINGFNDPVYAMRFPAYWYHDAMGPAYLNMGVQMDFAFTSGIAGVPNARNFFVAGDELALVSGGTARRGWVDEVGPATVHVIKDDGTDFTGNWTGKVVRSGHRNMQDLDMMSMTLKSDPLLGLQSGNVYANLLDVKATEYSSDWRTECGCVDPEKVQNDWLLDRKGVWRVWKQDVWLADRQRTTYDHNTDVRHDGVYTTFSPLYRNQDHAWYKNIAGWTATQEVTQYNGRGQELENKDALGLFSSATFGYRANLPKTVAHNARYRETGFDGFEEPVPFDCADKHFRFPATISTRVSDEAHTGRYSLKVEDGHPVTFTSVLWSCDQGACHLHAGYCDGQIYVGGGIAPYTLTPVLIQGNATFTPNVDGLAVTSTDDLLLHLHITDAGGCAYDQDIEVIQPTP